MCDGSCIRKNYVILSKLIAIIEGDKPDYLKEFALFAWGKTCTRFPTKILNEFLLRIRREKITDWKEFFESTGKI